MRVPLLDLGEQHRVLAKPIREQFDDVLRTNRFILGPRVEEFEQAICRHTGAQFAIGVSSGTDALLAILMALRIGEGDAVVTTPYTFFATAACIARVGATPAWCDGVGTAVTAAVAGGKRRHGWRSAQRRADPHAGQQRIEVSCVFAECPAGKGTARVALAASSQWHATVTHGPLPLLRRPIGVAQATWHGKVL